MTLLGRGSDQDDRTIAAEWRSRRLSVSNLFYVAFVILGLVVVRLGVDWLTVGAKDVSTGPAVVCLVAGIAVAWVGLACLIFPAKRVLIYSDGALSFRARRRRLEVLPNELVSVRRIWIDPHRGYPCLVRAANGRILLAPRLEGVSDLKDALVAHSSHAKITNLQSIRRSREWPRAR